MSRRCALSIASLKQWGIDMADIGMNEGDRCNRPSEDGFACDGGMFFDAVVNCSCHISPPCGACIDNPLVCSVCGAESEEE